MYDLCDMAKIQKFNIKYPFINDGTDNLFVDLNDDYMAKVRSELLFTLFTPKGSRLRRPEFGSDLIKFIFSPIDGITLETVKAECSEVVTRWVPNCNLIDIQVVKNEENEHEIFVKITYSVMEGLSETVDSVVVEL